MAKRFKVFIKSKAINRSNDLDTAIDINQGSTVYISAKAGNIYQLQDVNTGLGPKRIHAKRVGKNLHIIFDDNVQPDVIIENYFDPMLGMDNEVVGLSADGSLHQYVVERVMHAESIETLVDGGEAESLAMVEANNTQMLEVPELSDDTLALLPIVLGVAAGGAGIAFAMGGGDKKPAPPVYVETTDTTAPTGQTGAIDVDSDTGISHSDGFTRTQNPLFTGTAEANDLVEVTINNKTYSTHADNSGHYSIQLDSLGEGTYNSSIKVTDAAGNSSSVNGTKFTIDTHVENFTGFLSADSDSALSADGATRYTGANPLVINNVSEVGKKVIYMGHTEAGAHVSITIGDLLHPYTAIADQDGNYAVELGTPEHPLSDQTIYRPIITITDLAGNSSRQQAGEVTAVQFADFANHPESYNALLIKPFYIDAALGADNQNLG